MYTPYYSGFFVPQTCPPSFSSFSKDYWTRSLFQRLRTLYSFDGLPEGGPGQVKWDKDAYLYGLFARGFHCIFESKEWGVVFQPATPAGIGLFYQPTGMVVNTPYFSFTRPLLIGRECSVIKLTPDYQGVWDLVEKASSELMYMDVAIRLSQVNARFAYAIAADSEKSARSVKKILEQFANGEPGVVYDSKLRIPVEGGEPEAPWKLFDRELKKNFILPELLEGRKTVMDDFYREVGIRCLPDKKERYIQSEVSQYDTETYNRREAWNISLQESLDETNRMYGLNIRAKFLEPPKEVTPDASEPNRTPGLSQ